MLVFEFLIAADGIANASHASGATGFEELL